MESLEFCRQLRFALRCEPGRRHILFTALHGIALATYHTTLHRIDAELAMSVAPDGRSILEWVAALERHDRRALRAARKLASNETNAEAYGGAIDPGTDAERGDGAAERGVEGTVSSLPDPLSWAAVKAQALASSQALHDLFTDPSRLTPVGLSETPLRVLELEDGSSLTVPAGWRLWARAIRRIDPDAVEILARVRDETAGN
jgi:hypothetical protein